MASPAFSAILILTLIFIVTVLVLLFTAIVATVQRIIDELDPYE